MKIYIANDHRGVSLKIFIVNYLQQKNIEVNNLGTDNTDPVDYPIIAKQVCDQVLKNHTSLGIVICSTGIGVSIAANKVKGIRCAKVVNPIEAALSKAHNDANVLALSAHMDYELVGKILDEFIGTPYTKDDRHVRRLDEIKKIEAHNCGC